MSSAFADDLIAWFEIKGRDLPWRVAPLVRLEGKRPDPYHVWLSEIMLQQTTVATVRRYFETFIATWPSIADLARADDDAIRRAWAGLGYYSRCENMIRTARLVAAAGEFPTSEAALRALPGIGAYTAASIAAIAFDVPAIVIDGNVERVMARVVLIDKPMPAGRVAVRAALDERLSRVRPAAFAEAMMDLGATICTPRNPSCGDCPISAHCMAFASGRQGDFPRKKVKREKPQHQASALILMNSRGEYLLHRRPAGGLLAHMSALPATPLKGDAYATPAVPIAHGKVSVCGYVSHVFTHFTLNLQVQVTLADEKGDTKDSLPDGWWWSARPAQEALPTLFRKALERAAVSPL